VCPVVSPAARDRLAADIGRAQADGATVVLDGRGDAGPGGCTLGPTILDDVPAGHRVLEEELFGPVLTLVRAPDLAAAIELVNAGRYGNASVIFTESITSRRVWSASTWASPHRSRGSRSAAGRTRSTATSTPTAATRSSSTRARRW
jgi:malonate-semialdehyde dehydrogenase (acetylating)/methylmalonate-semialdehyde dehydrogenase